MTLKFLAVTSVPRLFWSAPEPFTLRPGLVPLGFLLTGLFLFGIGEALLVSAGLGVSPWTVFAQGLMMVTGWSLGFATLVLSVLVLALWFPLRQMPGIGTIANLLMIAAVLQFVLPLLPIPNNLPLQLATCVAGVLMTGIGGAIYLIANLGPGPRDGLMTGLQRVTGRPIAHVRSSIEVSVVCIGWLLGGTAGLGTLLFAFGIGPCVALGLHIAQQLFPPVTNIQQ